MTETHDARSEIDRPILTMPVHRAIFHLAWPILFSGILENIATTIDMIMVGKLGAPAIAAVGFCGMVSWTLQSLVMGISIAVTAMVARHVGAGEKAAAESAMAQAVMLSAALAGAIALVIFFAGPWILRLFGVEKDVYDLAVPYLRIISISGIFLSIWIAFASALRGTGDTRTPMVVGLIANIINVSVNYVLIFGKLGFPALGVKGAAIGSLVSLLSGTVMFIFLFTSGWMKLRLTPGHFRWDTSGMRVLLRMAAPASIEQFVVQIGLLTYAKFIVAFGTAALSGYQVGMQVLSLSFIPNAAFSVAASTLVGQNLGAKQKKEAKNAGVICLVLGTLSMTAVGAVALWYAELLAALFVKEPEVIRLGAAFISIVAFSQPFMAVYSSLAGALRGAGDTRSPMMVTLVGMYGTRIPGAFLVSHVFHMGIEGTFSLLIVDYMARVVGIVYFFQKGKWLDQEF